MKTEAWSNLERERETYIEYMSAIGAPANLFFPVAWYNKCGKKIKNNCVLFWTQFIPNLKTQITKLKTSIWPFSSIYLRWSHSKYGWNCYTLYSSGTNQSENQKSWEKKKAWSLLTDSRAVSARLLLLSSFCQDPRSLWLRAIAFQRSVFFYTVNTFRNAMNEMTLILKFKKSRRLMGLKVHWGRGYCQLGGLIERKTRGSLELRSQIVMVNSL